MKYIEAIDIFLGRCRTKRLAPNTIMNYETALRIFGESNGLLTLEIGDLTLNLASKWTIDDKYMKSSAWNILRIVRQFFRYLKECDYIAVRLYSAIEIPKSPKEKPKAIAGTEIQAVLDWFKTRENAVRNEALIYLMVESGMRVSEVVNLTVGDLNLQDRAAIVRESKGGKSRVVYFGERSAAALERVFNQNSVENAKNSCPVRDRRVFWSKYGTPLSRRTIAFLFWKCNQATGIRISPHVLRHTFATEMLKNGCDLMVLRDLMGHSDISTTTRYLKVSQDQKRDSYRRCSKSLSATIKNIDENIDHNSDLEYIAENGDNFAQNHSSNVISLYTKNEYCKNI